MSTASEVISFRKSQQHWLLCAYSCLYTVCRASQGQGLMVEALSLLPGTQRPSINCTHVGSHLHPDLGVTSILTWECFWTVTTPHQEQMMNGVLGETSHFTWAPSLICYAYLNMIKFTTWMYRLRLRTTALKNEKWWPSLIAVDTACFVKSWNQKIISLKAHLPFSVPLQKARCVPVTLVLGRQLGRFLGLAVQPS